MLSKRCMITYFYPEHYTAISRTILNCVNARIYKTFISIKLIYFKSNY